MSHGASYSTATRHPLPCLVFVLPLLALYEGGVVMLGGERPEMLRNGADHWLRRGLMAGGPMLGWLPPLLLTLCFLVWTCRRWHDRPGDLTSVLSGMMLESVGFALGLWGLSRALGPLLEHLGVTLSLGGGEVGFREVVRFIGSGIYEEAIFRLVLFSAMLGMLSYFELKSWLTTLLAAIGSATLFSAAHHLGPYGQAYANYVFLFRLLAGLYFALLYRYRGFGVAVGSHACYNVMVSVGAS